MAHRSLGGDERSKLLEVIDPRGRRVILWDDTWYEHICGPEGHMEMVGQVHSVRTTLEDPDLITQSRSDREVYQREVRLTRPGSRPISQVVMVFVRWIRRLKRSPSGNDTLLYGEVLTAYTSATHRRGAATTWQRTTGGEST